jgi:hypothetical protein
MKNLRGVSNTYEIMYIAIMKLLLSWGLMSINKQYLLKQSTGKRVKIQAIHFTYSTQEFYYILNE